MKYDFVTETSGKWILAGEHAVLRGCPALVFPIFSKKLHLRYSSESATNGLNLVLQGTHGSELELLVLGVLEKACQLLQFERTTLKGTLEIDSELPVGAGMGASAALCVALAQFFFYLGKIANKEDLYEFSRQLENLFHGESSGVDVAVALHQQPLIFERSGRKELFSPTWKPLWSISYSGQRGITKECVDQVKKLIERNDILGNQIDQKMNQAVAACLQALSQTESNESFEILKSGIDKARSCFENWGLASGAVHEHMNYLTSHGALAVKPTGSGGGGYVLALWKKMPPEEVCKNLIFC